MKYKRAIMAILQKMALEDDFALGCLGKKGYIKFPHNRNYSLYFIIMQ